MFNGPSRTVDQMEQDFRALIATVHNEHLRELLEAVFGARSVTWERFRVAPAAKHYHQAYAHGLLEHTVTVTQAVSALSAIFPGIDRDLAVSGALLHDIGKLDTYAMREEGGIEMTDDGRLQGEIVLGHTLVRAEIDRHGDFPRELRQALLHIILSHHGALEHGSPVVPCTREATLVHMADNLGSKLGSFDRIERGLDAGAQWANYDRAIGTSAYFGLDGATPELLAA
jgi:3'-5' exoribonuclease